MIRIITDSAADFSRQELADRQITCVPMHITFGEDTYTDGVDLPPELFWQRLTAGENPKTSQPSPDDFLTVFEDTAAAGDEAVCVLVSSALSGTLQSAVIAKGMAAGASVYIVDSLTAAIAERFLVLRACQLRDEGTLRASDIARELEAFRERIRLYACLDTLEYLARGGRIPKAAANLGSLIQLKPLVTLSADGRVELAGKGMGRHRATDALVKLACTHRADPAFPIVPIYAQSADNCAPFVKKLCASGMPCRVEDALPIGPTISTHIGPGAFGVVYVEA
ncbi:MAG: DegV family protein, partial [Clostridia bacterium]|nr:DegV family protein [Clostridia bacterium]